jgi:hypothetical protein
MSHIGSYPDLLPRMDDKSFGSGSEVGERIAGYERQLRTSRAMEDLHIVWINDFDCINRITKRSVRRRDEYGVLLAHVPQRPENVSRWAATPIFPVVPSRAVP